MFSCESFVLQKSENNLPYLDSYHNTSKSFQVAYSSLSELQRRGINHKLWLSSAGGGVSWLHFRIEDSPKYYVHQEYKEEGENQRRQDTYPARTSCGGGRFTKPQGKASKYGFTW